MPIIYNITTERQFDRLVSKKDVVHVLNFWASWAEPCQQMNQVFTELANKYPHPSYIQIEAPEFPAIVEKLKIDSVPSFLIVKENRVLDRIEGAKAAELSNTVAKYNYQKTIPPVMDDNALQFRLRDLIQSDHIMVFMKGVPEKPQCGFSKQVIEILSDLEVKYSSFNILTDNQVRQGLKTFSDWPTYPQIYVKGELVGGLDVLKESIDNGEFMEMIK